MKEIGVYIHIPFCKQKCYYCDFISFAGKEDFFEKYVERIKLEILKSSDKDFNVKTIYIGGGTPSCIEPKYITEILNQVRKSFKVEKETEITIEVNPGTISESKLLTYFNAGINRLSIGIQTLDDELLKQIGRIHNCKDALQGVKIARNVGFKNINVDLMLGLPGQTVETLRNTVKMIIGLKPEHISIYSLIVEEGTILAKMIDEGKTNLPEEAVERKMYWDVKRELEANGYNHYEISNFAREGYESKHNSDCWNQKEYLGFGVAAHSYINKKRYSNTENLMEYIESEIPKKTIHEMQERNDEMDEFVLLGFRKIKGIKFHDFKEKFGTDIREVYSNRLKRLEDNELIYMDSEVVKLTDKGIDLANQVWQEFC